MNWWCFGQARSLVIKSVMKLLLNFGFYIRYSVGFDPSNNHQLWDTSWCNWKLRQTEDLICISVACGWAQYKVLHYQLCSALRVNAYCISGTYMHIVPHCTHRTHCTHGIHCCHTIILHLVSLTIVWREGQWVLNRCCTSHKNLQILQNSTLQVPFSKAAFCLYQQLFNTLAVRELHCISTTHFLGYLYCIHYISCTPWFWVHFMLTSQYMYILELEGAEWCPLVETIVLPHLTCPRLVLGRHLFAGPLHSFESTLPMVRVVHPPRIKTGRYF